MTVFFMLVNSNKNTKSVHYDPFFFAS